MKLLFSILIALVIPLFFLLVFVLSQYQKLATLRRRCQETAARPDSALAQQAYALAVAEYNEARRRFPTNLIGAAFRFAPVPPVIVQMGTNDIRGKSEKPLNRQSQA